jgi:hypothetical protein
VRDHDHVAVGELDRPGDELGEVVALANLGQALDGDDPQLGQGRPVSLTPA